MSEPSLSTSSLQRVILRDADAWQRVICLYRPVLYSRCRRRGLQPDDAANVVQEVFLAAFKSVGNFRRDGPTSSFRSWLLGITANKLKDHWKVTVHNPQGEGGSEAQRRIEQLAARDERESADLDDDTSKTDLLRRALELLQGKFEERRWKAFWRFERNSRIYCELGDAEMVQTCPGRAQLHAFCTGNLPNDSFESVAGHVMLCSICVGILNDFSHPNAWLVSLRGAVPFDPFAAEAQCWESDARLVAKLQDLAESTGDHDAGVLSTVDDKMSGPGPV